MKPKRKKLLFLSSLSKLRMMSKRLIFTILFISALIFIMLSKTESVIIEKTSSVSVNLISPIAQFLSLPATAIADTYNYLTSLKQTYEENLVLKEENKNLRILRHKINALEIENKLLGELLNYIPPEEAEQHTVRVVAAENDAFSNSIIVYTGENKNIRSGQIAANHLGVVGRVDEVGRLYSKINLITDINIKIPITIERNRTRGILVGNNTNFNKIIFTPIDSDIQIGDRVLTSGTAGIFPPGIPVGEVVAIEPDIKVKPFADTKSIEYVQIISYKQPEE